MVWLFTCVPLGLVLAAWAALGWIWKEQRPATWTLIAVATVTVNAVLCACCYLHARFAPTTLPPWKDPVNLDAGLLSLSAPVGFVLALVAHARGAPKWLIFLLGSASLPLFLVGCAAAISV